MSSLARKIKRNQERNTMLKQYGKKPKTKCPNCGKLTLFRYKNKRSKEIICVQCGEVVNK